MMIVQCQACQTRFRVDESRIQGRGARMRCRRCGEAIIVMKESPSRPGPSAPKNLFDLRSVLRQPERQSPPGSDQGTARFRAREAAGGEPASPEAGISVPPWEPGAGKESPPVETPGEAVSLRIPEEAPAEAEPEAGAPSPPEEMPAEEEAPPVEAPGEAVSLRIPEEAPAEAEPEAGAPSPHEEMPAEEEAPPVETPGEPVSLRIPDGIPPGPESEPATPETPAPEEVEEEQEPEAHSPPEEPEIPREPIITTAWEPPAEEPSDHAEEEPPVVSRHEAAAPGFPAPEETEEDPVPGAPPPPEEPKILREPIITTAWEPPAEEPSDHAEAVPEDSPPSFPGPPRGFSAERESSPGRRTPSGEEKPFELLLNDADSLDFLKEETRRSEPEEELDISGILRSDPSPDPEPEEIPAPERPTDSMFPGEPMPDRLEAIQRELQEIGGGSPEPEPERAPSPPPTAASSVPPVRKAPPLAPRTASARTGDLRGGRPSLVPLAILFFLIAGGGAYLGFTSGGQKILRRAVPAMESLWLGGDSVEARYAVGNLIGYYEPNTRAGTLFVIKGTVTNRGRKKRSGIRVHAQLFGSGGTHVAEKTVFAGNLLPADALRSSSKESIEKQMSNRWGDKLSNLDVASGNSIPFMVVFFDAPAGIEEYRLEARDSE